MPSNRYAAVLGVAMGRTASPRGTVTPPCVQPRPGAEASAEEMILRPSPDDGDGEDPELRLARAGPRALAPGLSLEPEFRIGRADARLGQAQLPPHDVGPLHERHALVVRDPAAQA